MEQSRPLLDAERALLIKERATLIDRLALVERLLGAPSSIKPKQERQQERWAAERWDRPCKEG